MLDDTRQQVYRLHKAHVMLLLPLANPNQVPPEYCCHSEALYPRSSRAPLLISSHEANVPQVPGAGAGEVAHRW